MGGPTGRPRSAARSVPALNSRRRLSHTLPPASQISLGRLRVEDTGASGTTAYALRTEAAATRDTLKRVSRALVAYCAAPEVKSPLAAVAAVAARSLARGLWPDADGAAQLLQLEGLVTEPLLAPLAAVGATSVEALARTSGPGTVTAASIDAATRRAHPFGQRLKAAAAAVAHPALELRAATGVTQVGTGPGVAVLRIEVTEVAPSARGAGGVGAAWVPPPPTTAAAADAGGGGSGKGKKKGGKAAAAAAAAAALQQRAITDFLPPVAAAGAASGGSPSPGDDAALPPPQRNPFAGAPPTSLVPGLEQTYTLAVTTADGVGGLAHWQPGIAGPTVVTVTVGRPLRGPLVQVSLLHAWAHGRDVRITFQPLFGFGPVPRGLGPGDSALVRSLAEQRAAASNAATAAGAPSASPGGGSTLASASPASPADEPAAAVPAPRPVPLFRPAQPRAAPAPAAASGASSGLDDAGDADDDLDGIDVAAFREDGGGGAQMAVDGDGYDYDAGGGISGAGGIADDVDAAVDLADFQPADAPASTTTEQPPVLLPTKAAAAPTPTAASPVTVTACPSPLPSDSEGTTHASGDGSDGGCGGLDGTLLELLGHDAYAQMLQDYKAGGSSGSRTGGVVGAAGLALPSQPHPKPTPPTQPAAVPSSSSSTPSPIRLWRGLDDSDDEGEPAPPSASTTVSRFAPVATAQSATADASPGLDDDDGGASALAAARASAAAVEARRNAARAKLAQRAAMAAAAAAAQAQYAPQPPQSATTSVPLGNTSSDAAVADAKPAAPFSSQPHQQPANQQQQRPSLLGIIASHGKGKAATSATATGPHGGTGGGKPARSAAQQQQPVSSDDALLALASWDEVEAAGAQQSSASDLQSAATAAGGRVVAATGASDAAAAVATAPSPAATLSVAAPVPLRGILKAAAAALGAAPRPATASAPSPAARNGLVAAAAAAVSDATPAATSGGVASLDLLMVVDEDGGGSSGSAAQAAVLSPHAPSPAAAATVPPAGRPSTQLPSHAAPAFAPAPPPIAARCFHGCRNKATCGHDCCLASLRRGLAVAAAAAAVASSPGASGEPSSSASSPSSALVTPLKRRAEGEPGGGDSSSGGAQSGGSGSGGAKGAGGASSGALTQPLSGARAGDGSSGGPRPAKQPRLGDEPAPHAASLPSSSAVRQTGGSGSTAARRSLDIDAAISAFDAPQHVSPPQVLSLVPPSPASGQRPAPTGAAAGGGGLQFSGFRGDGGSGGTAVGSAAVPTPARLGTAAAPARVLAFDGAGGGGGPWGDVTSDGNAGAYNDGFCVPQPRAQRPPPPPSSSTAIPSLAARLAGGIAGTVASAGGVGGGYTHARQAGYHRPLTAATASAVLGPPRGTALAAGPPRSLGPSSLASAGLARLPRRPPAGALGGGGGGGLDAAIAQASATAAAAAASAGGVPSTPAGSRGAPPQAVPPASLPRGSPTVAAALQSLLHPTPSVTPPRGGVTDGADTSGATTHAQVGGRRLHFGGEDGDAAAEAVRAAAAARAADLGLALPVAGLGGGGGSSSSGAVVRVTPAAPAHAAATAAPPPTPPAQFTVAPPQPPVTAAAAAPAWPWPPTALQAGPAGGLTPAQLLVAMQMAAVMTAQMGAAAATAQVGGAPAVAAPQPTAAPVPAPAPPPVRAPAALPPATAITGRADVHVHTRGGGGGGGGRPPVAAAASAVAAAISPTATPARPSAGLATVQPPMMLPHASTAAAAARPGTAAASQPLQAPQWRTFDDSAFF
jgi:hypothetical protein